MIKRGPSMLLRPVSMFLLFCSVLSTQYSVLSPVAAQEVQWRTNYNLARKEALTKNRPLVLDFGIEQCFWCKRLDATTFRDARVIGVMNESFIPLRIDAERDARLTEALGIQSFPTLVLAAPDGKILGTLEGYLEAERLHDHLQRVLVDLRNAKPEVRTQMRVLQARELLAKAREDYRSQQYLCCLDRCERLATNFADLPEGAEGIQLATEIKNNREWLQQACETLSDRLSGLYLALAETCMKSNQPQQAAHYLERVLQNFPGTPQAETARLRLSNLQGSKKGSGVVSGPQK